MPLTVEQIQELETNAAGLVATLTAEGDRLRGLREKPVEQRSDNWAQEIRTSSSTVYSLDAELQVLERQLNAEHAAAMREQLRSAGTGPMAAFADGGAKPERRSVGQQLVDNERFQEWRGRNPQGSGTSPDIEIRATLDEPSAGTTLWLPVATPVLPSQAIDRRRLFIRDLISTGTTQLASIPYIVEHTPRVLEEGAAMVAEGAAKPEVAMLFDRADAPVRKIGAWIPATEEILEDAPTLRSYVDARLEYMVGIREEEQFLAGSGTSPELRGILNQVGLQTQAHILDANSVLDQAATIGQAIAKVENVDGEVDGVALNPTDFWTMVTTRHATHLDNGYGNANNPSPFGPPPQTVWGLPAVRTRSMTAGTALVGAYRMGAQAFDRVGFNIRVGDQHADYFINNKVAILGEKRVALAVYRPDWFVQATIS